MLWKLQKYIKDGLTHLSNQKYYQRLDTDFNPNISTSIAKFLFNAHHHGLIDKDTLQYLSPPEPSRTPLIYFLKKLHKTPISVRPIVSHINSPTCNISAFLDHLLQPIIKEINHILPNSQQLINELKYIQYHKNFILATLDVTSLYPNIAIEESIQIILDFLQQQNNPMHPPYCNLKQLLIFVLTCNCFNFANLFFLQVHGIAMGTKPALNYANLFMADFESKHVFTYPTQLLFYRRYIPQIYR